MTTYVFRTPDGEELEARYPMGEAPDTITLDDGRTAKRVPSWGGSSRLRGKGWARHPERDIANRKRGPQ